jgi:UDP-3-O-[3-hydroxymyristoyl] N-acetylglucosamine deacetylase
LDRAADSAVRFHPAPRDTGIVFVRADIAGAPAIRCCLDNARFTRRWSALEHDGHWAHHTEHILAAIAGCQIDNVVVELAGDRIPVVSNGSCRAFVRALNGAGRIELRAQRRRFRVRHPVFFDPGARCAAPEAPGVTGERWMAVSPGPRLSVAYVFQVPEYRRLPPGYAEWDGEADSFHPAFSTATTYLLARERSRLGRALGPIGKTFRIVSNRRQDASQANESARHKVCDLVGDLMLLGAPLAGRLVACRSGHQMHIEFVKWLVSERHVVLD